MENYILFSIVQAVSKINNRTIMALPKKTYQGRRRGKMPDMASPKALTKKRNPESTILQNLVKTKSQSNQYIGFIKWRVYQNEKEKNQMTGKSTTAISTAKQSKCPNTTAELYMPLKYKAEPILPGNTVHAWVDSTWIS